MSNILRAIKNIIENPVVKVRDFYVGRNRANSIGDALENYVKDVFADALNLEGVERNKKISEVFSYDGNQNNPPDIILRNWGCNRNKKSSESNKSFSFE